jgi:hypothetical protein
MKNFILFLTIIASFAVHGCNNDDPKSISASATALRNVSGEVVVRDATQAELDSIDSFYESIQKIDKKYPAPPTPLKRHTFAVKSITEEGVYILENNLHVKMSGIKCNSESVYFLRKFFEEETERLAYLKEKELPNGIIESYVWVVDSSMMNDPDMKKYSIGPSFSGMNDTVILNNWCEIDPENNSRYLSRYVALERISRKNNR